MFSVNHCQKLHSRIYSNILKILGASREWIFSTGASLSHQKSWRTLQCAGSCQSLSRQKRSNSWKRTNACQVALGRQILSSKLSRKDRLLTMEWSGMKCPSQMKTHFLNFTIPPWCLKIWVAWAVALISTDKNLISWQRSNGSAVPMESIARYQHTWRKELRWWKQALNPSMQMIQQQMVFLPESLTLILTVWCIMKPMSEQIAAQVVCATSSLSVQSARGGIREFTRTFRTKLI